MTKKIFSRINVCCPQGMRRLCQQWLGSHNVISKLSQSCAKALSKFSQSYPKDVQKVSPIVPMLSKSCLQDVPNLPQCFGLVFSLCVFLGQDKGLTRDPQKSLRNMCTTPYVSFALRNWKWKRGQKINVDRENNLVCICAQQRDRGEDHYWGDDSIHLIEGLLL